MPTTEPFETRFRHFYEGWSAEERKLLSAMCAPFLAAGETEIEGYAQARSDIGQKLQFQLNEANNVYTRMIKAQSDCPGYDATMRDLARARTAAPVTLARSVLARAAAELLGC